MRRFGSLQNTACQRTAVDRKSHQASQAARHEPSLREPRRLPSWVLALAVLTVSVATVVGCDVYTEPTGTGPTTAAPAKNQSAANGARIQFVAGFQAGYEQAIQQGRPMFVFFTGSWCHYCHEMEAEALADPQVAALADRFVMIRVDADAESETCRQFQIRAYPTVQFISPRGEPLQRLVGKTSGDALVRQMHTALDALARADATDGMTR